MIYMNPQEIVEKFGKFNGVIHVGAHQAEERNDYIEAGIKKRVWIEANPLIAKTLTNNISGPEDIIICAAISENDNEIVKFNVANNGQSSSILPLKHHANIYKGIVYNDFYELKTSSLHSILEKIENSHEYDFINLDIQGVELRALKGLKEKIKQFKAIYTEVNLIELYEKCDMMEDLDSYVLKNGFRKIGFKTYGNDGWGDALYIRD